MGSPEFKVSEEQERCFAFEFREFDLVSVGELIKEYKSDCSHLLCSRSEQMLAYAMLMILGRKKTSFGEVIVK